jgi:formylglycine-generating enzyme required for sulfatase activity
MDATERRHEELQQPKPPALLLYIDQGEELYVRAEERQRRRFSELINHGIGDHRLRALMSLRSDFLGQFQTDEALFSVGCKIDVPPLREQELRDVVGRPAELLAARFETDHLAADITQRAVTDSGKDIGALPLLSYLLDDMWSKMVERGDRTLRLPAGAIELGRVLVERANTFLADHPKAEDQLRRLFTLKLATVLEDGEPTRRRALRSEFTDDEWKSVTELADHPYRLLVTAVPELGETYAEVAHEAIFRRWDKLRLWIAVEREFLVWRSGLEAARRAWEATPYASKHDALLMGAALAQAQSWLGKRAEDLPGIDRKFILQSIERERRTRGRARRLQALVYMLLFGVIVGLIGWINQDQVKDEMNWLFKMRPYRVANIDPYVLDPDAERALKPQDTFRECAKDCPEMVAIPAGEFMMGSPPGEEGRSENEGPQHHVAIAQPFAVSKFDVTFADWDACASVGGCPEVSDQTYGRDTKPLMNVTWNDAQQYVAWLAKMTGRPYRLLTEAEWEYAARAGATTAYYWGDEIGKAKANCMGCGSAWDSLETSPVGSFQPNAFGLYDMAGDVWQWVQDCENINYAGVPTDGSAATAGDCGRRIIRGGSWLDKPENLRLARRVGIPIDNHSIDTGFRVGRTLTR